jgi:hypothetical protein
MLPISGKYRLAAMRLFLALWLGLVIAVSISPVSFKLKLHTIGPFHDFSHYIVYLLTGIFFWLAAGRWYGRLAGFVLGVLISAGQEWTENKLYRAGFEWKDVATDLAGLISGFALMLLITALLTDPTIDRRGAGF